MVVEVAVEATMALRVVAVVVDTVVLRGEVEVEVAVEASAVLQLSLGKQHPPFATHR